MPDIREVYEMVTKQKPAEPGALERQQRRQVRAARNKKFGGYAVAAAIGLVVVVALILGRQVGQNATTPADKPPTASETASGPFFLDLQTGKRTPLAENLAGGFAYAGSPDGTRLAYYGTGHGGCDGESVVTVANIDGTNARTLQSPEGLNICGARWSPDSTKLVYQERNGADSSDVGNLFVQDLSTGRRTQITDLELTRAWWWFLSPSFSPDGQNVVFHLPRDPSQTTSWDVWSVPVTGGEPTLLLRNASFPMQKFGSEGGPIAFVLPLPNNFQGRSLMIAIPHPDEDFRETLVAADDSIWWPTMSPDHSRIAYQDRGSIYVVDLLETRETSRESTKVADGQTAEWLDNDTLIVAP